MKYKIKVFYETGNSFNSYDVSEILDVEYTDLELAKESLKRIKEHYQWYEYEDAPSYRRGEKVKRPKWWSCKTDSPSQKHCLINLPTDSGKDFQMWAPWCGYFETLHGAKIMIDDVDLSFSFDEGLDLI